MIKKLSFKVLFITVIATIGFNTLINASQPHRYGLNEIIVKSTELIENIIEAVNDTRAPLSKIEHELAKCSALIQIIENFKKNATPQQQELAEEIQDGLEAAIEVGQARLEEIKRFLNS